MPILTPNSRGKVRIPNSKSLSEMIKCDDPTFVDFVEVSTDINLLEMSWMENWWENDTWESFWSSMVHIGSHWFK